MLAVHLRDLADALCEAPLAGGELASQLGHVCVRAVDGSVGGRVAQLIAERLDLRLQSGGALERGVALDRQRLERLVETGDLGGEILVLT